MDRNDAEVWRPLPHFPEQYMISSHGRIKRVQSFAGNPVDILRKLRVSPYGVLHCRVDHGPKHHHLTVAEVVCGVFNGERPGESYKVKYRDGNYGNIHASNLYWHDLTNTREVKLCRACGIVKPRSEFASRTTPSCRPCFAAYMRHRNAKRAAQGIVRDRTKEKSYRTKRVPPPPE
jgi:hypothetical protein